MNRKRTDRLYRVVVNGFAMYFDGYVEIFRAFEDLIFDGADMSVSFWHKKSDPEFSVVIFY